MAVVAALTCASHSGRSHQGISIIPARLRHNSRNSLRSVVAKVCLAKNVFASSYKRALDIVELLAQGGCHARKGDALALTRLVAIAIASCQHGSIRIHVARADLDSHRHAAQIPLAILPSRLRIPRVDANAKARARQFLRERRRALDGALVAGADDWDQHRLNRRHFWRDSQPAIVAMLHDQTAKHAPRNSPRGSVDVRNRADRRRRT